MVRVSQCFCSPSVTGLSLNCGIVKTTIVRRLRVFALNWPNFYLHRLFPGLCLLGATGLMGCASGKTNPRTLDLSQRLGSYSYRQAKADLGRPDVVVYADHGRKVAEWLLIKPMPPSFDLAFECDYTGPVPGEYGGLLRLEFDDNGQLNHWNRIEYGVEAWPFPPKPQP
jgi:hypothetical protein